MDHAAEAIPGETSSRSIPQLSCPTGVLLPIAPPKFGRNWPDQLPANRIPRRLDIAALTMPTGIGSKRRPTRSINRKRRRPLGTSSAPIQVSNRRSGCTRVFDDPPSCDRQARVSDLAAAPTEELRSRHGDVLHELEMGLADRDEICEQSTPGIEGTPIMSACDALPVTCADSAGAG